MKRRCGLHRHRNPVGRRCCRSSLLSVVGACRPGSNEMIGNDYNVPKVRNTPSVVDRRSSTTKDVGSPSSIERKDGVTTVTFHKLDTQSVRSCKGGIWRVSSSLHAESLDDRSSASGTTTREAARNTRLCPFSGLRREKGARVQYYAVHRVYLQPDFFVIIVRFGFTCARVCGRFAGLAYEEHPEQVPRKSLLIDCR